MTETAASNENYLYDRVVSRITRLIEQGTLRPGDRVPSIRKLSSNDGVSVSTVLQAYLVLESKGLIEAKPQSGFYVRPRRDLPAEPKPSQPPPTVTRVGVSPAGVTDHGRRAQPADDQLRRGHSQHRSASRETPQPDSGHARSPLRCRGNQLRLSSGLRAASAPDRKAFAGMGMQLNIGGSRNHQRGDGSDQPLHSRRCQAGGYYRYRIADVLWNPTGDREPGDESRRNPHASERRHHSRRRGVSDQEAPH